MYKAGDQTAPPPVAITFASAESLGPFRQPSGIGIPVSAIWVASNRTIYLPVRLRRTATAYRMFVLSGATVGTNTTTVALYNSDTNLLPSSRIVTASATAANANACQFFDITDTTLIGGNLYYMAMALNGTTATVFRSAPATQHLAGMVWQDTSNCPDPAVPAAPASAFLPVFGISLRSTP